MSDQSLTNPDGYPHVADASGYALEATDFLFLGIEAEAAWACSDRRAPLGLSELEFKFFLRSLEEALAMQSLDDADVRIQGSSTTFFSGRHKAFPSTLGQRAQLFMAENGRVWREIELQLIEERVSRQWPSGVPQQRPFDAMYAVGLSPEPSDIDIQVSSARAFEVAHLIARRRGVDPTELRFHNESYNFLIKAISDTEFLYLSRWAAEWEDRLNRGVSVAIFDAEGPPRRVGAVSSHFRAEDWVVRRPGGPGDA